MNEACSFSCGAMILSPWRTMTSCFWGSGGSCRTTCLSCFTGSVLHPPGTSVLLQKPRSPCASGSVRSDRLGIGVFFLCSRLVSEHPERVPDISFPPVQPCIWSQVLYPDSVQNVPQSLIVLLVSVSSHQDVVDVCFYSI